MLEGSKFIFDIYNDDSLFADIFPTIFFRSKDDEINFIKFEANKKIRLPIYFSMKRFRIWAVVKEFLTFYQAISAFSAIILFI